MEPSASAQVFTVINTNPSGAGSLSDAVSQANLTSGSTIEFSFSGSTITLTAPLTLSSAVSIDGSDNWATGDIGVSPIFSITVPPGDTVSLNGFNTTGSAGQAEMEEREAPTPFSVDRVVEEGAGVLAWTEEWEFRCRVASST